MFIQDALKRIVYATNIPDTVQGGRNRTDNNNNQKGWGNKSEHAVSAGKLQTWAKGYHQVRKANNEANRKALLDCQIITNLLFFSLVSFSSFLQIIHQLIPFASYGEPA